MARQAHFWALLAGLALAGAAGRAQQLHQAHQRDPAPPAGSHEVHFSEYRLRATIEAANGELRQLKRDLVEFATRLYQPLRAEPLLSSERAAGGQPAALGGRLLAAEFADLLATQHIVQRRLVSGLKQAFVRLLPLWTLRALMARFPADYGWLSHEDQVDLRPMFADAKESEFVTLYALIELRARIRAADDAVALTEPQVRRILRVLRSLLLARAPVVSGEEARALAYHTLAALEFYSKRVLAGRQQARREYAARLPYAHSLEAMLGGADKFLRFVDALVDMEALDIEVSEQALLERPLAPTISAEMAVNLRPKWLPGELLEQIAADRAALQARPDELRWLLGATPDAPVGADGPELELEREVSAAMAFLRGQL